MRFIPSRLAGAYLIEPQPIEDRRGFFARTFCRREFSDLDLETEFVQHSRSMSVARGTLRGMHFQKAPHAEVKVVSCVAGAILDVIVDLREASPTYRCWQSYELSAANRSSLYVPQGFAHGFQTLADGAEVNYLISTFYEPGAACGLRYDDPILGIDWPLTVAEISDRDLAWPLLD